MFRSHRSFYKYLPGTDRAVCTRQRALAITDMMQRTSNPRSLEQHETFSETIQDRAEWLPYGPPWPYVLQALSGGDLCSAKGLRDGCVAKVVWTCTLAGGGRESTDTVRVRVRISSKCI